MKCQTVLPACALLLLWTLAAFVRCDNKEKELKVKVMTVPEGIKLSCTANGKIKNEDGEEVNFLILPYADENSREYKCTLADGKSEVPIYVKLRTCDNCIELDVASISGIAIGDLVATIGVGVAVYLIASRARTASIKPPKRSANAQHMIPNEGSSSRGSNDHYQRLRHSAQKDTYDVIKNRR